MLKKFSKNESGRHLSQLRETKIDIQLTKQGRGDFSRKIVSSHRHCSDTEAMWRKKLSLKA